jgi:ABC-type multidrug transport system ATPase subunit
MSDLVAEVRDLRMRYGAQEVLNGVGFSVRTGEVLAMLGPNGAGKTTTIEILEGFRMRSDREQATVLLTTHDLAEAEKLADRVLILAGGTIIADGSPDELALRLSGKAEVRWSRDGQRYVHPTAEATKFTRELFAQFGESVADLEVRRASLEDTYMALVQEYER